MTQQVWWHTPVISALRRQRRGPAWAIHDTLSQQTKQQKQGQIATWHGYLHQMSGYVGATLNDTWECRAVMEPTCVTQRDQEACAGPATEAGPPVCPRAIRRAVRGWGSGFWDLWILGSSRVWLEDRGIAVCFLCGQLLLSQTQDVTIPVCCQNCSQGDELWPADESTEGWLPRAWCLYTVTVATARKHGQRSR